MVPCTLKEACDPSSLASLWSSSFLQVACSLRLWFIRHLTGLAPPPCLQVLREFAAAYGPLVILLEDLHHIDTVSWVFLVRVTQELDDCTAVLCTMRPNDGLLSLATRHQPGKEALFEKATECINALKVGLHLVLPERQAHELAPFGTWATPIQTPERPCSGR